MGPRASILKAAAIERFRHDSTLAKRALAWAGYARGTTLLKSSSIDKRAQGFGILMRLHAAALSPDVDRRIVARIKAATEHEKRGQATGLWAAYDAAVRKAIDPNAPFQARHPERYVGTRLLVIKPWRPQERGVLVVDYSNVFPIFAGRFDLKRVAERYTIVLEPSWTGLSQPDVLLFTRLDERVYVQTVEPRDRDLILALESNLAVVPVAANWWVDPRTSPPPAGARDIDIIMVASWADWKRHWRFFAALADLRKRGHRLSVALVGYNYGWTKEVIEAQAAHYGIRDQVQIHERIPPEAVWQLLVRSKIHVLWSRREGSNRAIIEAMMADVPVIVRDGLSFGHRYPYINDQTGRFVKDPDLADAMLDMIRTRDRYAPRDWISRNMTCYKAIDVLERELKAAAEAAGEPWTEGLAVKTSGLDTQRYVNPADRDRFTADYQFLESTIRRS